MYIRMLIMDFVKIVLISTCLLISFIKSDATKCYNCTGTPTDDCAKAILPMNIETCEGVSVCHYTDLRSGDGRSVSRGCTKVGTNDLCTTLYQLQALNPMAMKVFKCNTCSEDLCNVHTTD